MTVVCGVWSLTYIFSVILAGGVGKNGSTVAVSLRYKKKIKKNNFIGGCLFLLRAFLIFFLFKFSLIFKWKGFFFIYLELI